MKTPNVLRFGCCGVVGVFVFFWHLKEKTCVVVRGNKKHVTVTESYSHKPEWNSDYWSIVLHFLFFHLLLYEISSLRPHIFVKNYLHLFTFYSWNKGKGSHESTLEKQLYYNQMTS